MRLRVSGPRSSHTALSSLTPKWLPLRRSRISSKPHCLASSVESLGEEAQERPASALSGSQSWWKSPHDGQILRFAIPALLSNLILPISSAVDAGVVGRLGPAELSGVGVGTITLAALTSCLNFLTIITNRFVAQKHAEKKHDEISVYLARNLWFSTIVGSVISVVMFNQADNIMNVLRPAAEVRTLAINYMKTVAFSLPGYLAFLTGSGALRGLKDSFSVLVSTIINALVNASLDFFLVFGCGWSVVGAGIATVAAVYTSAFLSLRNLISRGTLKIKDILSVPNPLEFIPILQEGFQLSIRNVLFMAMLSTGSVLIAQRGAIVHSVFELCRQTTLLTFVSYLALEQTVQSLAASSFGLRDFKSSREIINRVLQITFAMTIVTVSFLITFSNQFAHIFTRNAEVISGYTAIVPLVLAFVPLSAIITVIDGALIGANRTRVVALSQALGYAIALSIMFALQRTGNLSILAVWMVIRFGTIFSGLMTGPYLFSSKSSPYGYNLLT